jgi:ABC-type Fe3+ transport system substrate-binding protein
MKIGSACAAIMLFAAGPSAAQSIQANPTLAQIIDGAKREGKLLVRSNPASTLAGAEAQQVAQQGIKRLFGIDLPLEWSPGAAYGPLAAQLFQEMQAGTPASTDVLALQPAQIVPYLEKGLFRTVDWRAVMPSLPPDAVEASGKALRIVLSVPNVLYNIKAAPWIAAVNNSADLLRPEIKGKFMTTPFLGGFDALLGDEIWGVDKTTAYVKQLAGQIAGFTTCGSVDRIASGEIPALALDCSGGWPNSLPYRGKNVIAGKVLGDIAERRYSYLTIPRHAAHPNAAILYALYLLSPEGQQKVMADYTGLDLGLYRDSYARQLVESERAQGITFIDVTVDWWQAHPTIDRDIGGLIKLVQH